MSETKNSASDFDNPSDASNRRSFVKGTIAAGAGICAVAAPLACGTIVFLDPIIPRKGEPAENASDGQQFVKVTSLDSLEIGQPQLFKVYANRVDAWNRFVNEPIGAVFLQKMTDESIVAWNSRCPHLGCSVEVKPSGEGFVCPCHLGEFDVHGKRENQIVPRDLDQLAVDVRGDQIWVEFKNYRQGLAEKIELA